MTERELVRCGCGAVRNDDDQLARPELLGGYLTAFSYPVPDPRFESPRACRRCGCVYMLPKPSAPKESKNDA